MQVTDDTPPKSVNTSTDDVQLLTPFLHKGTTPSSSDKSPSEPSQSPRRPLDDFVDTSQNDAIHSDSEAEPHPVNTGKRPLRSRKTLFMSQPPDDRTLKSYPTNEDNSQIEPNVLQQQFHRDEIQAQEIFLRPRLPGQTTEEKILPTRYHFEYIYTNIHDPELYDYVENIEKWVKFNLKHQLYPDQSKPILDLQGEESTETEFSLTTLLVLNKDLINKKLKEIKKLHKQQSV